MRILPFFLSLLAGGVTVLGADRTEIILWPDGSPEPRIAAEPAEKNVAGQDGIGRRYNVSNPRLVVFEPVAGKSTGAGIIVVPGGGFNMLADTHEGSDACEWLSRQGITAFLLRHRCPPPKGVEPNLPAVQDLHRGMQLVRKEAARWKVDPKKIGVLGFSAGGQATAVAASRDPGFPSDSPAGIERPDFLLLIYPWKIYDEPSRALRSEIKPERFPPTFVAQAADDKGSLAQGSTLLFLELINRKIPAEIHVYEHGGHGFGMKKNPQIDDWIQRAEYWLRSRGLAVSP